MKVEALDPANHTARVTAQGTDAKSGGDAQATASFRVEPAAGGSKVLMHMELMLSGGIAQYGRGVGMVEATAARIMNQFADNLRAQVAGR
jgi:carbon monoxide dehydrogenase subunit G